MSLSAKASYQTDVTKIPFSLPGIDIPTLSKDQYQVVAEVNQVIWDGGNIRAKKQNVKASAEVDLQQQQVDMYAIRERVNSLFFGILLTEEQLELNRLYDEELERNYRKISSFIENGVANQADLDAVQVEQLSNRQQRVSLEATNRAYRQMLGAFIGENADSAELICPVIGVAAALVHEVALHGLSISTEQMEQALFRSGLIELTVPLGSVVDGSCLLYTSDAADEL